MIANRKGKEKLKKFISLILMLIIGISLATTASAVTVKTYGNSHAYDRVGARNYAATWVEGFNPNFYNYTDVGGDCTNFVSQAIRQGGIAFTGRAFNPGYGSWYYYGKDVGYWGRSRTWTHAHYFRQHFGDVNGTGAKRSYQMRKYDATQLINSSVEWGNLFNNAGAGDVVQYTRKSDGQTIHSQIIHRKSTEDGRKISMAQHTPNKWANLWHFNNDLIKEGKSRWLTVIKLDSNTTW